MDEPWWNRAAWGGVVSITVGAGFALLGWDGWEGSEKDNSVEAEWI